jgi:hypothetical protein
VRRDSIFEGHELSKPFDLGFAESGDVLSGLGTAENGNDGDEQDFAEGIVAGTGSGIVELVDGMPKMNGDGGYCCLIVLLLENIGFGLFAFLLSSFDHKTSTAEDDLFELLFLFVGESGGSPGACFAWEGVEFGAIP